jgi:hypothetical protein
MALVDCLRQRSASAITGNASMKSAMHGGVLFRVDACAQLVQLACESVEILQLGLACHQGDPHRHLRLERLANHEMAPDFIQ